MPSHNHMYLTSDTSVIITILINMISLDWVVMDMEDATKHGIGKGEGAGLSESCTNFDLATEQRQRMKQNLSFGNRMFVSITYDKHQFCLSHLGEIRIVGTKLGGEFFIKILSVLTESIAKMSLYVTSMPEHQHTALGKAPVGLVKNDKGALSSAIRRCLFGSDDLNR